ncbi:sulfotransferase family protein [bacterium]|nr:sulfotransferase family protein [bacterium]
MVSEATFLLGVGAQKAGTSWLHDQLQRRSDADFGFLKEYHVFDALELERFAGFRPKRPSPLKWRTWRRAQFIARPERYFDYFAARLKPARIRLTGDITPSYAGLSAESYQRIQQGFAQRGVKTRAVFIMRDPVERFLSQQRMQLRKRGLLTPAHEIEHLDKASLKLLKRESPRNDYPATLDALRGGLAESEIFIGLYETLFTAATHRELCRYLGIPEQVPDVNQRVNASQATTAVPLEVLQRLGQHFSPLVAAVQKRYPDLAVEQHWATAMNWREP